jgi:5-methylcytosine-specific restriction endonuclease McrA
MKLCKDCEVEMTEENTYKSGGSYCKPCAQARTRRHYHENKEKRVEYGKTYKKKTKYHQRTWLKEKLACLEHYSGGKPYCKGCGIENLEVLTIDHIHEDGAAHRKEIGQSVQRWLIANKFPEGFQVLCWNCNNAKHRHGEIPRYTYRQLTGV